MTTEPTEERGKWDFEDDTERRWAIEAEATSAAEAAQAPTAWIKHVVWATALIVIALAYYYARMHGMGQ